MGLGANKSPPTFAPARRCKDLICTIGNLAVIADKSDDFLPSIINPFTLGLFPPFPRNLLATVSQRGIIDSSGP
jgi:hypothetical protein